MVMVIMILDHMTVVMVIFNEDNGDIWCCDVMLMIVLPFFHYSG